MAGERSSRLSGTRPRPLGMHSFVGTSFEAGETRDGVDHTITLDASGVDYATDSAALDGVAL